MGDISSTYQLGAVNTWTQNQLFNVWMPKSAHPVGVVAKSSGYDNFNLELVCIQNSGSDTMTTGRKFVATTQGISGESLMFIGSVQLQRQHSHQIDVQHTMVHEASQDHNGEVKVGHTHSYGPIMTDEKAPEVVTLLVFEVGDE